VHERIIRQLSEHFGSANSVPSELRPFVDSVERSYLEFEVERARLETLCQRMSEDLAERFGQPPEALTVSQLAREDLKQAVSLLAATLESTTDGILVVNRHGKMVRMNRKFVELWRMPDELAHTGGDTLAIQFVLDQLADPEQFTNKVNELYEKPDAESFDVLTFKDGRIFERYSLPQRLGGETVGRVWSFRDVTSRRQLEEQLRQSQKMEAIGALAGGVAHDFNNLLTVIRGHAELLLESLEATSPERADVDAIATAANRAAALTRHLLAFSRKQMLQPVPLDLTAVITALTPMLRRLIGEDIGITITCEPVGVVIADPGQMEQVVLNLVVNARDAMPSGGRIEITTRNVDLAPRFQHVDRSESLGGPYVLLAVSDTGPGIAPDHRDRIFEPFFTTKGLGQGTGLGLSTVFGIVKQSGGQIALETEIGQGSTFRIYLPRVGDGARAESNAPIAAKRMDGAETILLAEDEDAVRALVCRVLEQQGYKVVAARDGAEALRLAAMHEGWIDLLLSDVIMPGMGGIELSDQIRRVRPGIRVLYMSGYTESEIDRRGVLGEDAALLEKPFTGHSLAAAVRAALAKTLSP
jgi:two-component system cell cycle sensor histidine kinase/response regulator CckA